MFDLRSLQATPEPDDYGYFGAIANDETSWRLFDDQLVWDGHGWSYDGIHQSPLQELPMMSPSPPKHFSTPASTMKLPRRSIPLPAPVPLRPPTALAQFSLTGDTFVLPPGSRRIGQGQVQGVQRQYAHASPYLQAFQPNAASMSTTLAGAPASSTMQQFNSVTNRGWVPPPGSRRISVAHTAASNRPEQASMKGQKRQKKKHSIPNLETVSLQQMEHAKF